MRQTSARVAVITERTSQAGSSEAFEAFLNSLSDAEYLSRYEATAVSKNSGYMTGLDDDPEFGSEGLNTSTNTSRNSPTTIRSSTFTSEASSSTLTTPSIFDTASVNSTNTELTATPSFTSNQVEKLEPLAKSMSTPIRRKPVRSRQTSSASVAIRHDSAGSLEPPPSYTSVIESPEYAAPHLPVRAHTAPQISGAANGSRTISPRQDYMSGRASSSFDTGKWMDEGSSTLFAAAEAGQIESVESALLQGANIDSVQSFSGRTALHVAIAASQDSMVTYLLQRGANIHASDSRRSSPLHVCAQTGLPSIAQSLLDRGAYVEVRDDDGKTPLEVAASSGQPEITSVLLDHVKRLSSQSKPNDQAVVAALRCALESGNVSTVEVFLASDAVVVKKVKSDRDQPLLAAARGGNLALIDMLLANKCNIKEKSTEGWTALHFAAHLGHVPIVERLLQREGSLVKSTTKKKETALHLAIKSGYNHVARILIQTKGAPITARDTYGDEPLHTAIRVGSYELVSLLLESKVGMDVENEFGWRPIHIAAAYGHLSITALLITRAVNIEEKTSKPSYQSAKIKMTHEVVKAGMRAEACWPHPGSRPLHLATEFGCEDIVSLLLEHGAKPDESDSEGWRPLHHAAFCGLPDLVESLLAKGAYPHAVTSDGKTALSLGFRTSGPPISDVAMSRVCELLETAQAYTKKKKLDSISRGLSFGGKSAEERDQAWRTAALAATTV